MKIIVAHEGKQHVNRLLIDLAERGWLQRFYVGFASNHLPAFFRRSRRVEHWLRKRQFTGIDKHQIQSLYVGTLLARLTSNHYWQVRYGYRLFDWWTANKLRRNPDFDLLIGYENGNCLSFQAARQLGRVTVLDLAQLHHATIDAIQTRFNTSALSVSQTRYVDRLKQSALNSTDYILTLSSLATDSLIDNGIDRHRIYEVNLGVDVVQFRPAPKPADGRFRVLFVGTITHRKGIRLLLSAFRALTLPGAELVLVGPVQDAADLLTLCTGPIRHVPFLHHDDLVGYYQQADVFVFPSYLDSWGQVVLEAMACGTPVIVSDNTGAKDAVRKGGGFVIPTGDEIALRKALLSVYGRRGDGQRLGEQARRVAEQYTWANYYQQVGAALTDIARREHIPVS